MPIQYILLGAAFIWLIILTVLYYLSYANLARLNKQAEGKDLVKILNNLLVERGKSIKGVDELKKEIKKLEDEVNLHVQKVGLVRFNPFDEIGGDHSFSLALMDKTNTGVLITGLHTRQRTRLYVKYIKNGKGDHDLSKDEEKAIKAAQKR